MEMKTYALVNLVPMLYIMEAIEAYAEYHGRICDLQSKLQSALSMNPAWKPHQHRNTSEVRHLEGVISVVV
jgi:hypothetical protein